MRSLLATVVVLAALLAGCGGNSDEDLIRDQAVGYVRDLQAGDIAAMCERTANPRDCIATFRAAEMIAGGKDELLVAAGVTDETVKKAKAAPITVEGDNATIKGQRRDMEAVRVDGEWKLVLPEMR